MSQTQQRQRLWLRILTQLQREWSGLPPELRTEISVELEQVITLQQQMQALFSAADGDQICCDCAGACCRCGQHHLGLVNLLALLSRQQPIPEPDYARGCPWLSEQGCSLAPGFRPFNCVSFVCESIEQRLTAEQVEEFYLLEKELRRRYQHFADHFPGAGFQGILLRFERLEGGPLLSA